MKASVIKFLIIWLVIIGLFTAIDAAWQIMEIAFYGVATPSVPDLIIGIVLAVSLYGNIFHRVDFELHGGKDEDNG